MTASSRPLVEVRGARELRRTLKNLGDDLGDFTDVHARIGTLVGREGAARVHSRTGALAGSARPAKSKTAAAVRFGGARLPYAGAVHWGTGARPGRRGPHNIAPQRFATDAAADTEPTWTAMYADAVDEMLARVKGD